MNFLKNLSIGGKIISILLLVIIMEILISLVGIMFLKDINTNLNNIVEVDAEKIKLGLSNYELIEV